MRLRKAHAMAMAVLALAVALSLPAQSPPPAKTPPQSRQFDMTPAVAKQATAPAAKKTEPPAKTGSSAKPPANVATAPSQGLPKTQSPANTATAATQAGQKTPQPAKPAAPGKAAPKTPAPSKPAPATKPPAETAQKPPAKKSAKAPGKARAKAPVEKPATPRASVSRRDPFEPLVGKERSGGGSPERLPPGKAGLVVSTLRLDGIVRAPNGMIAVVSNPQQRVYFLRDGDQLYDGRVERITMDAVSFNETGKDAFGKPVDRTVTKRLYPSPGEQR